METSVVVASSGLWASFSGACIAFTGSTVGGTILAVIMLVALILGTWSVLCYIWKGLKWVGRKLPSADEVVAKAKNVKAAATA